MLKLLRIIISVTLVGIFLTVSMEASAKTSTANASVVRGPTQLIYTDHVVGLSQRAVVTIESKATHAFHSGHGGVAPSIITQPSNETVAAGSTASFSASASGTPAPSVQWRDSTNGHTWGTIRGATSTTYSFTATSSQNGEEYEAVFANSAGSATTSAAILTVTVPTTSYTVTFNANGGTGTMAPETESAPTALIPNSFSRSGYTFSTWNTALDGSGTPYANGATYPFTSSATLYAQWTAATSYTVTFNANGGTGTMAPETESAPTALIPNSFSRSGYTFSAWNTALDGSGTPYANGATYPFTSSATLYAQWTANATSLQKSTNWSGYADSGTTFSAANGTWTVPNVTCPSGSNTYSAAWVGIDGFSSPTVEQDGTEADCINGVASYDAWYEMFGDSAVNGGNEVELSPATNPVSPGDTMTASVSFSGGMWTLTIDDVTHWSSAFSTTIAFSTAAQSSAEWVVERPEICNRSCSLTMLADFGSVSFQNATTTTSLGSSQLISANSVTAFEMASGGTVLAIPAALNTAGTGFTDTWQSS